MKKKISAVLAAAILVLSMSGCSDKDAAVTDANGNVLTNGDSYATWKDIDRDKVIAYVEGADSEKFDITFGEFYSEYLYYLISYNIADDMDASYKGNCEAYREEIITYLTFERIFLEIAEEMGCGRSSLTEADMAIIQENIKNTTDNFISNYTATATEELGEGATEDEILNRATELLTTDLARAELTTEIFEEWEINSYIQEKLTAVLNEDISITDADVDAMFEEYVAGAKAAYESSKLSYESNDTYTWIYVPEGTRLADQILVAFDAETQEAISAARQAGNDEEADKLREDAYNDEMKEKVGDIMALIEGGSNFDDLQATYNEDGTNDPYAVIVGAERYVPEFTEAIFSVDNIGDVAEPAVTDYGVHIIKYVGDESVTDEELVEIKESMKSYLQYQEETKIQQAAYEEWMARFPYTIDYDLLQITVDEAADDVIVSE